LENVVVFPNVWAERPLLQVVLPKLGTNRLADSRRQLLANAAIAASRVAA
jgi:hypothetical protein